MTVSKFLRFKKATRGGEMEGRVGRGSKCDGEANRQWDSWAGVGQKAERAKCA
jgi:hypothetical protein